MVVSADADKPGVVVQPMHAGHRALMSFEDSILDSQVLPEREHLHIVVLIVASVHMTSICELYLSTASHFMVLEFCLRHIILV